MYIPKHFEWHNQQEIYAFLQQYSFAQLIAQIDGKIVASHLPFVVEMVSDKLILSAHVAKNNPHAALNGEVLLIFSEPHAYISPKHYETKNHVPTWNYAAVHIYAQAHPITEETAVFEHLLALIRQHDTVYETEWKALSPKYKTGMANGLVVFEFEITAIEAKAKLSQNRSPQERQNII
jgi:transcriptional regulator